MSIYYYCNDLMYNVKRNIEISQTCFVLMNCTILCLGLSSLDLLCQLWDNFKEVTL